jgi:asparagine synthase (glutamine-hydrolysing)
MKAAGHDPTFIFSPAEDKRLLFFRPVVGIGQGIWSEMGARHSVSYLDPTSNLSLIDFLLRVPDEQFHRRGKGSWLFRRALGNRLPEPVLQERSKGLQAADLGHRILLELPTFRECLDSLNSIPEAARILDLNLMGRCLNDLVAKVDPNTTARAAMFLLRGLGIGLFLRRLAHSRS